VDTATENISVAASNRIIRNFPAFGKDPTGQALYVSDGLNKLDITQPSAPLELEGAYSGCSSGGETIAVNPTGTRLVLSGGCVLRASELTLAGTVGPGLALYSSDGSQIVTAFGSKPIVISRYDAVTLDLVDLIPTGCTFDTGGFFDAVPPTAIQPLPGDSGWAILAASTLCLVRREPDELFAGHFE
jgi:hypothetical protein